MPSDFSYSLTFTLKRTPSACLLTENCCPLQKTSAGSAAFVSLSSGSLEGAVSSSVLVAFIHLLIDITPTQPIATQKFMSSCCHATFFPSPLTNSTNFEIFPLFAQVYVLLQHLTILLGYCNIHGVTTTPSSYYFFLMAPQ